MFDEDFDCGLTLSAIRPALTRPTISLGARTADSLQALPMDMDLKPQDLKSPTVPSGQTHPEIPRRRPARQSHDTHGSLQEVLWAILFGGGLAVIWIAKSVAWLFRSIRNLLVKKPSD